jgi:hypothetical protein
MTADAVAGAKKVAVNLLQIKTLFGFRIANPPIVRVAYTQD